MIPDKTVREATKNEYISDHGGDKEWLRDLLKDQIQKEGSLFFKNLMWLLRDKIKGYSTSQIISVLSKVVSLDVDYLRNIMKDVKEEK